MATSLDSYTHNRNTPRRPRRRRRTGAPGRLCGLLSALGQVEHDGRQGIGYARIYCKGWLCPRCGPLKAAWMRRRIGELAREHGLNRFLTLTLDPSKLEGQDGGRYLRGVWAKFRTYLRRQYGTAPKFISVVEATKAGTPHLHLLLDRYLPQHWISDKWSRLGGGRIVFIEQVHDLEKCGWYLGKYLTKEMIGSDAGLLRRVTTSRGIRLQVPREGTTWDVMFAPLEEMRRRVVDGEADELDERGRLKFFFAEWTFDEFKGPDGETIH